MTFPNEEVYNLIDGIMYDWHDFFNLYDDDDVRCVHCLAENYNSEPEKIKHEKSCPYPLAVKMNKGRDFFVYPLTDFS